MSHERMFMLWFIDELVINMPILCLSWNLWSVKILHNKILSNNLTTSWKKTYSQIKPTERNETKRLSLTEIFHYVSILLILRYLNDDKTYFCKCSV